MNPVMTIVRTILPSTRPADTHVGAEREPTTPQESEEVSRIGAGAGLPGQELPVQEPAVDLAALLPRQAGPGQGRLPRDIDDDCGGRPPGRGDPGGGGQTAAHRGEPARADTDDEVDAGMSTAEYAIGTVAAAALAAVLYMIVTGDSVTSALTSLIEQALSVDF